MRRPNMARSLKEILKDLAVDANLPANCVFAGLQVLTDMNLIELHQAPPFLRPAPRRKVDPLDNPVFQWMRQLSQWGGEPLDE